jgi:hypothetical protein
MSKKEKKTEKAQEIPNEVSQETVVEQPIVAESTGKGEVSVSPEEARIIELEAEVDRLSKELASE